MYKNLLVLAFTVFFTTNMVSLAQDAPEEKAQTGACAAEQAEVDACLVFCGDEEEALAACIAAQPYGVCDTPTAPAPCCANFTELQNQACLDSFNPPTGTAPPITGGTSDPYYEEATAAINNCINRPVTTAQPALTRTQQLSCLGTTCNSVEAGEKRQQCQQAAIIESNNIAANPPDGTEDTIQAARDAQATVDARRAALQTCEAAFPDATEAQQAANCAEHRASLAEAQATLAEAQADPEAAAYLANGGLSGEVDASRDREQYAEGLERLQSQSGFFDINNLSVGNEKFLEIGGADNNKQNILARVINVMARLFGTAAVLSLVIGAFFMITSQGEENQLQKGKTILLYTILGLLIGFTAYMMVQFVINILFQT